tara:strand:+ start:84 stop:452 length:369 start_codon:yes stop_codon:yes gene_type:complete
MKTYTQLIEELAEAKGRLVPHEVLTNIKKKRTPKTNRRIADAKETLARKTSGRTNLNDPPDVLGAEVAKQEINAIRAGSSDTIDGPVRQGFGKYMQNLKKGKYTDAQVGGTRFDQPKFRGRN